jgi:Methyltransferase domain
MHPSEVNVAIDSTFRHSMLRSPEFGSEVLSWHGHIPFAFWCIDSLEPRVFVELGCHRGDSYLSFCQAVEELATKTRCFAVDTWRGDEHAGFYGKEVYEELKRIHDPRFGHFSQLVPSTFDDARDRFADGSVDVLHIDGCHTYEMVKHDFESWLPKMSPRGVVLLHDICVHEEGFGVWKLWNEVRGAYPSFGFGHSHGLGILSVGPETPDPIRVLADLDDDGRHDVQQLFARLGGAVLHEIQNRRLKTTVVEMQAALQERDAEIGRLHTAVQERDAEIGRLHTAVQERDAEIGRLHTAVQERDAEIGRLQTALKQQQSQTEAVSRQLNDRASLATRLESDLREIRASTSWRLTRPLRLTARLLRGKGSDDE